MPMDAQYPLTSSSWGPEEIQAIERVIKSGRFTMGENVKKFEQEFAAKLGSKYAVMVNSGSSANLVSVASLFYKKENPLKAGDEVIVPAISWATTYHPLQQYGLKLKFVDVELETLNMDVSQLEKALTPKTRMLVAVSILGNPAALDVMRGFCDRHGLYFLEDNCESMGATLNGKQCGTFGDLGTFSCFYSHHISTIEGGVILTDDEELYQLSKCIRAHGWTRDLPEKNLLFEKKDDDFFEAYRFILPGYNVRPMEFSGATGLEQLKKLDKMIEIRQKNAIHFQELFKNDRRFIIQRENGKSSWFSFTFIVKEGLKRSKVLEKLKKHGVEYRIITGGNFLKHDVIKHFNYETLGEMKNANFAHDNGFFVGNFPYDARPAIDHLRLAMDDL
jgi:CDP-6-deoxy-D-xylo-4-hexulose-3-dehydrase